MDDDVRLRPVADDADFAVFERLNDRDVSGPYNWIGFRDLGELRRRFDADGLVGLEAGRLIVWRGDERLGFVAWRKVDMATVYSFNVGIHLLPEARGKGYGTTAQRRLVEYLFATTPVHRIEADTEVTNIAEQRALEKAGFRREGVLRGAGFRDGRYRDGIIYSILRDEVDLD